MKMGSASGQDGYFWRVEERGGMGKHNRERRQILDAQGDL